MGGRLQMSTTVTILGSTGMLGSAVSTYFLKNTNYKVYTSYRDKNKKLNEDSFAFDTALSNFEDIPESDYIINCIGVIKPMMENNHFNSVYTNSIFPHLLSDSAEQSGAKLIHITTDCVFSGVLGNYSESSAHDCLDDYGKTKSLGEPDNCMVLRTSIIGEEVYNKVSLIEWAKTMKDQQVNGFTNHYWNGMTTKEYAKTCHTIIENDFFEKGLFHIFSPNTVSKFDLLNIINNKFELNMKVNKFTTEQSCDRSLATNKNLNSKLDIRSIQNQIKLINIGENNETF